MKKTTFLQSNLKNSRIIRWPDHAFPIKVFVAPFRWYKAKNEGYKYQQMIMDALNIWEKASNGKIRFKMVGTLTDSQINIEWKRVDRKSLGHCYYNFDNLSRLYSAEVQIGLSDGVLHSQYMDEKEVFHTIIHEIGHAIGLGHSPDTSDIMYTPHQYGVVALGAGDIQSIQWLYRFPCGASVKEIATAYSLNTEDLDEIVLKIASGKPKSKFEEVKNGIEIPEKDLLEEHAKIGELKKYNLSLQNIGLDKNIDNYIKKTNVNKKL